MAKRNQTQRAACPFELSMDVLSGKWKGMIIFKLKEQTSRFSELKNILPDISNRILTRALRELEEDGLIIRYTKFTKAIEVEYTLSNIGKQLIPVFMEVRQWGIAYKTHLQNKENLKEK